ncbi:hypothetical protein ACGF5F_32430 [Streptomyces sp. NPDC047821]|uniref:hypothetical protein n=1 Tax=Streptomyces sp. NPDC047821 TaxID=3365488 RepID=UPI0037200291
MSRGIHRLTRAGLREQLDETKAALRAEKTTSARLADQIELERGRHTEALAAARQDIDRLLAANRAWQARYANEHAMSDLPQHVETVPHGTDVRTLRQQFGPVVQVPVDEAASKPTHVPSWADPAA